MNYKLDSYHNRKKGINISLDTNPFLLFIIFQQPLKIESYEFVIIWF